MRRPRVARAGSTRASGVGDREGDVSIEDTSSEDDMVGVEKRESVFFFFGRRIGRHSSPGPRPSLPPPSAASGVGRTKTAGLLGTMTPPLPPPPHPLTVLRGHSADVQALAFVCGGEVLVTG